MLRSQVKDRAYDVGLPSENGCVIGTHEQIVLHAAECPSCQRLIIEATTKEMRWMVSPRHAVRRPIHPDVPPAIRPDYMEAVLVLSDSPKASAALSRRCLQSLLVLQGARKSDLVDQLTEIYPLLPGYVQPYVDHVRQLGNISAHAKQSKATGEIVEVEAGEADWMLELLEELFDHFYTKPAEAKAKQAALNAKFADAGRLKS